MANKRPAEHKRTGKRRPAPQKGPASKAGSAGRTGNLGKTGSAGTTGSVGGTGSMGTTGNVRLANTTGSSRPTVTTDRKRRPASRKKRVAHADVNANFRGAGVQTREQVREQNKRQKNAPRLHARKTRKVNPFLVGGIAGAVLLLAVIGGFVYACSRPAQSRGTNGQTPTSESATKTEANADAASVSFCAVGANIANADILKSADAWAGAAGDGTYDFSPLYDQLRSTISGYDVSFVSQGSTLGGTGTFEYQGYPSYNTPDSMADALEGAGFGVVNCNTNHTYDMWVDAIAHSQSVWAQHPNVMTIGSYASAEERNQVHTVQKNGMTIAFLSYSYGQNGYQLSQLPNDYFAVPFNKDAMRADVERAREVADAVVVYMHWNETDDQSGSTDTTVLSDEQLDYASFLSGLGVDLVIGCRGQSISKAGYVGRGIRTTDGSGVTAANGMLCVYGLGDFVSAYTLPSAVLSGMFTCDFVRDAKGEVSVENPVWHGLIEHRSGNVDCVYPLKDYTAELASSNELLSRLRETDPVSAADPLQWARNTTTQLVGDAITVEV